MAVQKRRTLSWIILGFFCFCESTWALESATVKSLKAADAQGSDYLLMVEQEQTQRAYRINKETIVAIRFSADKIVAGDRVWRNQNVQAFKGVSASIPLSSGASRWFGIPRIRRVSPVPGFQQVPEKNMTENKTGVIDGSENSIGVVQAVQPSAQGVTLVMKGSEKKRFYPRGERLWKVVSPGGLRAGMVVQLDADQGQSLKHLLVDAQ